MELNVRMKRTVAIWLATGPRPSLYHSLFLLLKWKAHVIPVKDPLSKTVAGKSIPLRTCFIIYLYIRRSPTQMDGYYAQLSTEPNIDISFTDKGCFGYSPTSLKVVSIHASLLTKITILLVIVSLLPEDVQDYRNSNAGEKENVLPHGVSRPSMCVCTHCAYLCIIFQELDFRW